MTTSRPKSTTKSAFWAAGIYTTEAATDLLIKHAEAPSHRRADRGSGRPRWLLDRLRLNPGPPGALSGGEQRLYASQPPWAVETCSSTSPTTSPA